MIYEMSRNEYLNKNERRKKERKKEKIKRLIPHTRQTFKKTRPPIHPKNKLLYIMAMKCLKRKGQKYVNKRIIECDLVCGRKIRNGKK